LTALDWLQRAVEGREPGVNELGRFNDLRGDPRSDMILRQIGLP
jgi:hypothetical protein